MITVEEARNIINNHPGDFGEETIHLHESIGRVLAEEIVADRDFPPFDRVTMDGVAFNYASYTSGRREFKLEGTSLAGESPKSLSDQNHALEIMTGAVLARGCDAVVRYEDLEFFEKDGVKWVRVMDDHVFEWKNVHRQANDGKQGDVLIPKEQEINSALISILATVGKERVKVGKLPKMAVIATGDELVEVNETPLAHQIRKSNVVSIKVELDKLGIENELFHLNDDKGLITDALKKILNEYDAVILSGGVSKGKVDHVPGVLEEMGVQKLFHRVAQRPGKPFWFGVFDNQKPVFAFPGNPISTYTCFKVYFQEWLDSSLKCPKKSRFAILNEDFVFKPDLGYFLQVRTEYSSSGSVHVFPQTGNGSGDIANLSKSDGIVLLPSGKEEYKKGTSYEYFPY